MYQAESWQTGHTMKISIYSLQGSYCPLEKWTCKQAIIISHDKVNQRGMYRIQRENRGRPRVICLGVPRQFRVTAYFSPSPPPSPHPKLHYVSSKLPHLPQVWSSNLWFAVSTLSST